MRSSFSITSRARARSESSSKPRSKRSIPAALPAGGAADVQHDDRLGAESHRVEQPAWTSSSAAASARTRSSSEFSTVYWPGWVDSRMSRSRRSPTAASSLRALRDLAVELRQVRMARVGRERVAIRYMRMSCRLEVVEDRAEPLERDAQVRARLQRRVSCDGSPPSPRTLTAKPSRWRDDEPIPKL